MRRTTLALSLMLLLVAAGNAFAGAEARMAGKVLDASTKQPIKGAVINVDATEGKTVKQSTKAKDDGSYAIFLLDGTIHYQFKVSAPGYDTFEDTIKLKIGGTNSRDFELYKAGTTPGAAPAAGSTAPQKGTDPATLAYNEGAALANAGDAPGAIAKFEAAVALKPDLLAGWTALAKMYLRQKSYAKAIEAAGKILDVDDSDIDMIMIQYQSYTALGDKANAAKLEPKLPKNAGSLFNDAAKLINAGDDAGAEKLLKQAVAVDDKLAVAHYELGMLYVRAGKNAEAKAELQKYLEIEPNGKDAPTAKEMMNYLK